jgi:hypothetical protein
MGKQICGNNLGWFSSWAVPANLFIPYSPYKQYNGFSKKKKYDRIMGNPAGYIS